MRQSGLQARLRAQVQAQKTHAPAGICHRGRRLARGAGGVSEGPVLEAARAGGAALPRHDGATRPRGWGRARAFRSRCEARRSERTRPRAGDDDDDGVRRRVGEPDLLERHLGGGLRRLRRERPLRRLETFGVKNRRGRAPGAPSFCRTRRATIGATGARTAALRAVRLVSIRRAFMISIGESGGKKEPGAALERARRSPRRV